MSSLALVNVWPDAVPLPLIDYTAVPRNTTLVSQVDSGIYFRRSRSTKTYTALNVRWSLGTTEMDAFADFYSALGNGVAIFAIDLRYPLNSAVTAWAVRFKAAYDAIYSEGRWQVSAALELVDRVVLPDPVVVTASGNALFTSDGSEFITSDGSVFYVTP